MALPSRCLNVHHTRLARIRQVLIHWQGEPAASATWEDLDNFQDRYPSFHLEDELLLEGGEMLCGAAIISADLEHEVQPVRPQEHD